MVSSELWRFARRCLSQWKENVVFGWVIMLGVCAVIAFVLGFFALAGILAFFAQLFFLMFLALLVMGLVSRWLARESTPESTQAES